MRDLESPPEDRGDVTLGTIVRREFLSNILTFRFAIGLIIYLALMVICTYISTFDIALLILQVVVLFMCAYVAFLHRQV
jgi:hypothetical protein